jgi:uncharacterized protein YidB (DUF937 family)
MNFSLTAWPCYRLKSLAWKGLGMGRACLRDGSPLRGILVNVLGQSGNLTGGAVLADLLSSFERTGLGHLCSIWIGNGPIKRFPGQL